VRSDRTLRKWYKTINKRFFGNDLPDNVCVRWGDEQEEEREDNWEDKYFGDVDRANDGYHEYVIVLSEKRNTAASQTLSTLIHEMIHISTGLKDNHGPVFEAKRVELSDKGIFKKHALIKNLTIF
jgi:hypothetical protein